MQRLLRAEVDRGNHRAFGLGVDRAGEELHLDHRPFDAQAERFVREFEYDAIQTLTVRQAARIQDVTLDGIRRGLNERDVMDGVRRVIGDHEGRVRSTARTEMNRAANFGRYTGWKESGIVRWKISIATLDDRVRPDHLAADGERAPIDQPFTRGAAAGFLVPPYGPNCLPGGQRIAGVLVAATRMRYAGRLVRVRTAAGFEVAATPNHPILTPHGFVPLGAIHEGAHVLRHQVDPEPHLRDSDEHDQPATAAQVFDSFQRVGSFPTLRSAFHGDAAGGDGHVDIVMPSRPLRVGVESEADERVEDGDFTVPNVELSKHPCLSSLGLRLNGINPAAACLPRSAQAPFGRFLPIRPTEFLRFGFAAELDARLVEAASQQWAAPSGFVRKSLQALARFVAVDEVTQVRNLSFDGHVYDFQARNGAYWSNGIALHNCRCTSAPVTRFTGLSAQAVTMEIHGLRDAEMEHERRLAAAWNRWPAVLEAELQASGVLI